MSEKLVTVAAFNTPLEAHMVRSRARGGRHRVGLVQ